MQKECKKNTHTTDGERTRLAAARHFQPVPHAHHRHAPRAHCALRGANLRLVVCRPADRGAHRRIGAEQRADRQARNLADAQLGVVRAARLGLPARRAARAKRQSQQGTATVSASIVNSKAESMRQRKPMANRNEFSLALPLPIFHQFEAGAITYASK